jgi:hypothetical protein
LTEGGAIRYEVAMGFSFQSIHFVMREGSHRPAMAYIFFTGAKAVKP